MGPGPGRERSLHPGVCKWRLRSWDLLRRKEKNICHVKVCLLSSAALQKQRRRVEEGRIKWRHLASIGAQRGRRAVQWEGVRQPTLAKPKSACNSPQPKETTKGAQGFFPCRLELQRHIIKIFIERWLVGAGVGGRSLGVAITIAHLRPQAGLPACLPCQLPLASTLCPPPFFLLGQCQV